jgi:hypothetical protein
MDRLTPPFLAKKLSFIPHISPKSGIPFLLLNMLHTAESAQFYSAFFANND